MRTMYALDASTLPPPSPQREDKEQQEYDMLPHVETDDIQDDTDHPHMTRDAVADASAVERIAWQEVDEIEPRGNMRPHEADTLPRP